MRNEKIKFNIKKNADAVYSWMFFVMLNGLDDDGFFFY